MTGEIRTHTIHESADGFDVAVGPHDVVSITVETITPDKSKRIGRIIVVPHDLIRAGAANYLGGSLAQAVTDVSHEAGLIEKE